LKKSADGIDGFDDLVAHLSTFDREALESQARGCQLWLSTVSIDLARHAQSAENPLFSMPGRVSLLKIPPEPEFERAARIASELMCLSETGCDPNKRLSPDRDRKTL
jgi:hypothetical protein